MKPQPALNQSLQASIWWTVYVICMEHLIPKYLLYRELWQETTRLYKDTMKAHCHWYKIKPKKLKECVANWLHWYSIVCQISANFIEAVSKKSTFKENHATVQHLHQPLTSSVPTPPDSLFWNQRTTMIYNVCVCVVHMCIFLLCSTCCCSRLKLS